MEHKYNMLVSVLDKLRAEAPNSYKTYRPRLEELEAVQHARSLAFIHLLLKVRKAYEKLVFPLSTGTYYDPEEIVITIELAQKEHPRLKQTVDTEFGQFNVTAIFVPTSEVGRILSRYKNAILKYNPRNFLSL